jgi:hypothetical protein
MNDILYEVAAVAKQRCNHEEHFVRLNGAIRWLHTLKAVICITLRRYCNDRTVSVYGDTITAAVMRDGVEYPPSEPTSYWYEEGDSVNGVPGYYITFGDGRPAKKFYADEIEVLNNG